MPFESSFLLCLTLICLFLSPPESPIEFVGFSKIVVRRVLFDLNQTLEC